MPQILYKLHLAPVAGVLVLGLGCTAPGTDSKPAESTRSVTKDARPDPGVAPGGDAADARRRAAWRASVQYRSAHEATVRNRESYAADLAKIHRLLTTAEALERVPVVSEPAKDAEAMRAALRKRIPEASLELVAAGPPAAPLPERAAADAGVDYTLDRVAGMHRGRLQVKNGLLAGRAVVKTLRESPRMVFPTGARIDPDGSATITFQVPFFRDVKPTTLYRVPIDVDARLEAADLGTVAPSDPKNAARVKKIRDNYAAVESLDPKIAESLALQASFSLESARFKAFSDLVQQAKARGTWKALLEAGLEAGLGGGSPAPKADAGVPD